ncbi:MAG: DUF2974 domain-containing protein [Oscillibacter sp.]|nr:DUF2974 domain-containing protein [Oscillibacter sp.]MBR1689702.1 DUF2974 domain-containing protein [Oscillibacter sp.]
MANLLDYLDWRGDLTLAQSPFNEVDNLVLSELSFVDFRDIVPAPGKGESVELRDAAEQFFARFPQGERIEMGVLVPAAIPDMLRRMASSRRFGTMKLNCFVDKLDHDRGEQFAALTVETGDGALYLAFRGTDDTLAGWKEDFELTCMPEVPAQKRALLYTRTVARQFPKLRLRLGGHSKGGNLAVYAGVFCPATVQRRIETVWSNDGPGFRTELLGLPQHQRIAGRIVSIVPKSSVVGMLLEHEEVYTVVDSDQLGFLQHDGFSWQVMGDHFLHLREVTPQARLSDLELRDLVQRMTAEQREKFVTALFDVLTASGAQTLTDLRADRLKAAGAMIRAMNDLDKETRDGLWNFIGILFKSNLRMTLEGIQEGLQEESRKLLRDRRETRE